MADTAVLAYRRDIDGLRAVAVVPVVLFHAGVPGFGGGFVGVDIFFVISGYLITQVLIRDGAQPSIVAFYERRIRRIIPALAAVILFCIPLSLLLLLPVHMKAFAVSVAAAASFVSNIWFANQGGYFATQFDYKPLFHTWSLGVEEQFYIFYPLLLWAAARWFRRWLIPLLAVILAVSLIAAEYGPRQYTFFLAPFRAWELMLGCLLALGAVPPVRSGLTRQTLAVLGAALIAVSVFVLTGESRFPGFAALLPCGGAALLVYANAAGSTWIGTLLETPPLVFAGLISYSWYLWHWPLIVFARLAALRPLTAAETALIVAAGFVLAVLSWAFVERPFRRRDGLRRKTVFAAAAGVLAALFAFGAAGALAGGWPQRWSRPVLAMADTLTYMHTKQRIADWREGTCFMAQPDFGIAGYAAAACFTPAHGRRNLLLWGDSLAAHLAGALAPVLAAQDIHMMQATAAGCRPGLATAAGRARSCAAFNAFVLQRLSQTKVDAVVLSAFWSGQTEAEPPAADLAPLIDALRARHIPVILIGLAIEYDQPLPALLAMHLARDGAVPTQLPANIQPHVFAADRVLRERFGSLPGVTYLSIADRVCTNGVCPTLLPDGSPLQFDIAHLTAGGARLVAAKLFDRPVAAMLGLH